MADQEEARARLLTQIEDTSYLLDDLASSLRRIIEAVDIKPYTPDPDAVHRATIECGNCHNRTLIALGMASAIACPECKCEIRLGEG